MAEGPSLEYSQGWESLKRMIVEENASWSGRERNNVYLNLRNGTFADVSTLSAADSIGDGRALAAVDWDDDGRVDLVLRNRTAPRLQLFRNQDTSETHFLAVDLEGTTCNRDAIGARVTVEAGGKTLERTLQAGDGFLAQSSKRLHFGLGDAQRVDRLSVAWPGGETETFEDLVADTRYAVVQGAGEAVVVAARTHERFERLPAAPSERDTSGIPRLDLREKIPLAPIVVPSFEDQRRKVSDLAGGPVLLNLWSTTCAACLREFGEFEDHRGELDEAGLRLVTLATDAATNRAAVDEILARHDLEPDAGYVDEGLLELLELLLAQVVGSREATPLPTSFLLDERGQLVAIYFGPIRMEQLLADLDALARMDPADLSDTRLTPGGWLVRTKRPYNTFIQALRGAGRGKLASFYRQVSRGR
jgi:peroxiredoxin